MERRKSKGLIVFIVILIICIIGLVFYILVDKNIIKLNNTTVENEQVEKNNTNDDTENNKGIELSIENENVIALFNNAHRLSIGPETQIYRDGGYKVSEMTPDEKYTLLASQWYDELNTHIDYIGQTNDQITELNEEILKSLYERTFGPNTYERPTQITDGLCATFTYDEEYQGYIERNGAGCGGTSAFSVHEKIISATKYSDRIEIVSATVYLDGMSQQMYKDYNKTTSLGELLINENITNNREERENTYNQYIEDNKDKLEQYTYTYTLNEDSFYYLTSVKRTKE